MTTAIVILNWNGKKHLETFLPSVVANSQQNDVAIYVADNCSSDDSVSFVKQNFPSVKLIQLESNYGYAKGYNIAISRIEADVVVLLNSDVEVSENWLNPILTLFETDKNIAAIQPKILDYNNKQQFEYAGAAGGFIDKLGYPFCRGRIFNELETDNAQYNNAQAVFWATGACLFVRKKAFIEAEQLDEDFFAHMEEIDLCWRLQNIGYQIWVEPKSVVFHVGGGTLNKVSPFKTYLNFRNNLYLLTKNSPGKYLFLLLLCRLFLDGIAGVKFLLEADAKHCWAIVRAHFYFYYKFFTMFNKRNTKKFKYKNIVYCNIQQKSIVWSFYAKKLKKFSEL